MIDTPKINVCKAINKCVKYGLQTIVKNMLHNEEYENLETKH